MISTPAMGCRASVESTSSAGGQLEQPSDVKSSTTTGTRAGDTGWNSAATTSAASKTYLISAPRTQHSALSTQQPAPSTQHPAPSTQHPAPATACWLRYRS